MSDSEKKIESFNIRYSKEKKERKEEEKEKKERKEEESVGSLSFIQ